MYQESFQLHGHMHNSRQYNLINRDDGVRRLDVGVDANGMSPVSAADIFSFWNEEYGDKAYGRIKPDDIRLEMTCSCCPEQYDAFDLEGNLIGYLRLRHGIFRVDCPDCDGETVFEGSPYGQGCFEDFERDSYLKKSKRAIAKYYRWEIV